MIGDNSWNNGSAELRKQDAISICTSTLNSQNLLRSLNLDSSLRPVVSSDGIERQVAFLKESLFSMLVFGDYHPYPLGLYVPPCFNYIPSQPAATKPSKAQA